MCDHNLHASLVEGALRSPARTVRFRHNDMEHLERCLENYAARRPHPDGFRRRVQHGRRHRQPARRSIRLAKPYGARTFVDEAHGIGVLGPTGAGAAEHLGVLDEMDIVMGTFSKSLASVGGFVASSQGRDRLPEARGAAVRLLRQPAGGIGGRGGHGAGDGAQGAGTARAAAADGAAPAGGTARCAASACWTARQPSCRW